DRYSCRDSCRRNSRCPPNSMNRSGSPHQSSAHSLRNCWSRKWWTKRCSTKNCLSPSNRSAPRWQEHRTIPVLLRPLRVDVSYQSPHEPRELRDDQDVVRLKDDVLGHVLAFDHIFVVELDLLLGAVRAGAQDVDLFLLGEIAEASAQRDGVEHGQRASQGIIA